MRLFHYTDFDNISAQPCDDKSLKKLFCSFLCQRTSMFSGTASSASAINGNLIKCQRNTITMHIQPTVSIGLNVFEKSKLLHMQ